MSGISQEREAWAIELYINDRYFRDTVNGLIQRVVNYTPSIAEHMIGILRTNREALIDAVELCLIPELVNAKLASRPISAEDAFIEFRERMCRMQNDGDIPIWRLGDSSRRK